MKLISIAGIALVVLGAFLLFRGSYTRSEEVLEVGGFSVTASERRPISPWIGGATLAAGVALVIAGARKRA
jgi:hypothetical protein